MPLYAFRCTACGRRAALFYKSYAAYDQAAAQGHACPHCGSTDMTRLISRVAIARPARDYAGMSSGEMLSVLEGGDGREVGAMMQQLGQDEVLSDPVTREATERLLRGESPERVARDLGEATPPPAPAPADG